jgi:hypothetical protein
MYRRQIKKVISNMFYQECERLAREKPTLEKQSAKINILIYKVGKNGVIRPDEAARMLNEPLSQVSGVLRALRKSGLLNESTYFECPSCGNLVYPKDYEQASVSTASMNALNV